MFIFKDESKIASMNDVRTIGTLIGIVVVALFISRFIKTSLLVEISVE